MAGRSADDCIGLVRPSMWFSVMGRVKRRSKGETSRIRPEGWR